MVILMHDVFYVSAITVIHAALCNVYYVHTNAGTSVYWGFDKLPKLAKSFLDRNVSNVIQVSASCSVVPDGRLIHG